MAMTRPDSLALPIENLSNCRQDHLLKFSRRSVHLLKGRLVVDVMTIRQARHAAAAAIQIHRIRLVVVAPIAHILNPPRLRANRACPRFPADRTPANPPGALR